MMETRFEDLFGTGKASGNSSYNQSIIFSLGTRLNSFLLFLLIAQISICTFCVAQLTQAVQALSALATEFPN